MKYDPVKKSLGKIFNRNPLLRILFYRLLDLLLLRSWHIRKELKILCKVGFRPGTVADAGSGFGQYVYFLSRLFPQAQISGLDIKQEQIDDCNDFFRKIGKQDRVGFRYADLTNLNTQEKYDLILCVDVMEHIEDDRSVLGNFYRSLRPGGVLLISTPSDKGGSDVHDEEDESFIEEHVRDGYGISEIEEKLRDAGFGTIHTRYSYGRPGKISWKISMKIPILMVNTSKLLLVLLPFYYLLTYPVCYLLNRADVMRSHSTGTGLIVRCTR
jgi:SAM-dependent methyltransferase